MAIDLRATATAEPGKISGRITRVKTTKPKKPPRPTRYTRDTSRPARTTDETGTIVISVSLTRAELAQLDAYAERVHMSRSDFLRRAFKAFGAATTTNQTPQDNVRRAMFRGG